MNFADVRAGIASVLTGLGLNGYEFPTGGFVVPAGVVGAMRGDPHADFDGGVQATVEVLVLLATSDNATAWADVDAYLEPGGPLSVTDALEAPGELGVSCRVVGFETVPADEGDVPYIGVRFTVEVLG